MSISLSTIRSKVLIIEDEMPIREFIGEVLSTEFQVLFCSDGSDALATAERELPQAIVLDLRMPGQDGLKTCQQLRTGAHTAHIPVIVVTALNGPETRVRAFECGANDFVAKPFLPNELLMRVRAKILPQGPSKNGGDTRTCGNLILDLESRQAIVGGKPVDLRDIELKILLRLLERPGKICSRSDIARTIWGDEAASHDRNLDPHVFSLRKKLKGFNHRVKTSYGQGFILTPTRDPVAQS